jgi:hypothetical protein
MKNSLITFVFFCLALFAQAQFEGKIVTKIDVISASGDGKDVARMLGDKMTTYIKGSKSRVEQKTPIGSNIILSDTLKKESVLLLELMGKKIALVTNGEVDELEKNKPELNNQITLTNETKMILGHSCKKAVLQLSDQKGSAEIWFSPELPNFNNDYPELVGMPLEYTVVTESLVMKFLVTEITPSTVDSALFEIPAGYDIRSQEELKGLFPALDKN